MLYARRKMGLVFFPAFDWAIDDTHPEREERLLYTRDQVFEEGVFDFENIIEYNASLVENKDIQRVHFCIPDIESVSTESHFISAGGAKTIADAILKGEIEKGFALVRPPGHHAMRVVHGGRGFCNINIEAIMIEYLRWKYKIKKIAIIDTDAHHGDGTQDIYWHDPDILFISLHQDGRTLYPGSGFPEEFGGPNAVSKTINIPLPPGTTDEGYLYVIENVVMPILNEFEPEFIVNSAGQDNHYTDPLANMKLSARGYATLNQILNPHVAVLEGGYSIEDALPYVNLGIILAMSGMDFSKLKEPDYDKKNLVQSESVSKAIKKIGEITLRNWRAKESKQAKIQENKDFDIRNRRIFYDTDGIQEEQRETIRICKQCGGTLQIETESADRGNKVLAIHIPQYACSECAKQGKKWFNEAKSGFDFIALQDKEEDKYILK